MASSINGTTHGVMVSEDTNADPASAGHRLVQAAYVNASLDASTGPSISSRVAVNAAPDADVVSSIDMTTSSTPDALLASIGEPPSNPRTDDGPPAAVANGVKLETKTKKEQGDPGYANALLSLGQDLTKSQSLALAATQEALLPRGMAQLPNSAGGAALTDALASAVVPPAVEAEDVAAARSQQGTGNITTNTNKQKRKHSEIMASNSTTKRNNDDFPPDFWYWLPPGQEIGDWDVLCGRGGESNNFAGNKRYRKVVNDRKEAYRKIDLKLRKMKTAFVRDIVQHINNCGGKFIDVDDNSGRYYVVTMEKARKKTSQALRETKELKWLEIDEIKAGVNGAKKKSMKEKDVVCPFCKLPGHKTRIASACLKHHEWLDASKTDSNAGQSVAFPVTPQLPAPSDAVPQQLPFLLPKDSRGLDPDTTEQPEVAPEPPVRSNSPTLTSSENQNPTRESKRRIVSSANSAVSV